MLEEREGSPLSEIPEEHHTLFAMVIQESCVLDFGREQARSQLTRAATICTSTAKNHPPSWQSISRRSWRLPLLVTRTASPLSVSPAQAAFPRPESASDLIIHVCRALASAAHQGYSEGACRADQLRPARSACQA